MMKKLLMSVSLLPLSLAAQAREACEHTAERVAEGAMDAVSHVIVRAGGGELQIEGEAGRRSVSATGIACAPREKQLDHLQVRISREGDSLVVATEIPEGFNPLNWFRADGVIDLTVKVPAGISIDVEDSSGSAMISKVGSARITDSSGDLHIENIKGSVTVGDGSGQVFIHDIQGPLRLADGAGDISITEIMGDIIITNNASGAIKIEDVQGSVTIGDDGAGDITVERVSGSVKIEEDGAGDILVSSVKNDVSILRDSSGEIEVAAIDGDFTLEEAGSGGVRHQGVGGNIRLAGVPVSNPEINSETTD
jgi:DUF4097 and DUF4098 domain-containing protein YvlB